LKAKATGETGKDRPASAVSYGEPDPLIDVGTSLFPFSAYDVFNVTLDAPVLLFKECDRPTAALIQQDIRDAKLTRGKIVDAERKEWSDGSSHRLRELLGRRRAVESFLYEAHRDLLALSRGARFNTNHRRHWWLIELMASLDASGLIDCSTFPTDA
jgi:hypothetical protein